MKCPFCSHPDTRVADSRLMEERNTVRRRRHCPSCGKRFGTLETVEFKMPSITGHDKKRRPFDRSKLHADLTAEYRLYNSGLRDISSTELVDMVLKELLEHNTEAAVRFAALHKRFNSTEHFASWLAQAVKTGGKA